MIRVCRSDVSGLDLSSDAAKRPLHRFSSIIFPCSLFFLDSLSSLHTLPVSILCHLTVCLSSFSCLLFFLPESLWLSPPRRCKSGWMYLPKDTGNAVVHKNTHTYKHSHSDAGLRWVLQEVCTGTTATGEVFIFTKDNFYIQESSASASALHHQYSESLVVRWITMESG